jgi:hypothetical protein
VASFCCVYAAQALPLRSLRQGAAREAAPTPDRLQTLNQLTDVEHSLVELHRALEGGADIGLPLGASANVWGKVPLPAKVVRALATYDCHFPFFSFLPPLT